MTVAPNNLMQVLLVLLLQSTGLLLLGLLALRLTQKRGPAVQTLVGRASLVSVALLVLLLPLTGHVPPVVRVTIPTPLQAVTLPPLLAEPRQRVLREGAEVGAAGIDRTPAIKEAAAQAASLKGPAEPKGAASSAPTVPALAVPAPRLSVSGGQALALRVASAAPGGFLLVSAALLLWLGICQWHLTRLRRTSQFITTGPAAALLAELTPNPPRLLSHPSIHSPFLAGYSRPVIFLPLTSAPTPSGPSLSMNSHTRAAATTLGPWPPVSSVPRCGLSPCSGF